MQEGPMSSLQVFRGRRSLFLVPKWRTSLWRIRHTSWNQGKLNFSKQKSPFQTCIRLPFTIYVNPTPWRPQLGKGLKHSILSDIWLQHSSKAAVWKESHFFQPNFPAWPNGALWTHIHMLWLLCYQDPWYRIKHISYSAPLISPWFYPSWCKK